MSFVISFPPFSRILRLHLEKRKWYSRRKFACVSMLHIKLIYRTESERSTASAAHIETSSKTHTHYTELQEGSKKNNAKHIKREMKKISCKIVSFRIWISFSSSFFLFPFILSLQRLKNDLIWMRSLMVLTLSLALYHPPPLHLPVSRSIHYSLPYSFILNIVFTLCVRR